MAYYHKQIQNVTKKRKIVSYVIRDKVERYHRSGVNSLEYDASSNRLYTAGRDSIVRVWGFDECSSSYASKKERLSSKYKGGQQYSINNANEFFIKTMEHHTDWVNDMILCCNNRNLITVSNDTTIKVWDTYQGYCLSTLKSHKDYAKCLAYAKSREIVASAGFDRMIYLWDIQSLTALTATNNTVSTKTFEVGKSSIYSLAINQSGTLLASGSTEKVIRLWDPRTRDKLLKLRGHADNVRSLVLSKDGTQLLSGSSDGTVRLWSVGQQRCIGVIRVHDEGVWSLQANESFSTVYSGGKDCKVIMTDLKNLNNSKIVCRESAPILKLLYLTHNYRDNNQNGNSIWVSTTDSAIKNWSLVGEHEIYNDSNQNISESHEGDHSSESTRPRSQNLNLNLNPKTLLNDEPDVIIHGKPAIIKYHILNDKRHILTKETDGGISLYDVLTAKKISQVRLPGNLESLDDDFENEVKKRFEMVYVPNWFSVDLKIGLLCIHLEESECFAAWVSARDYEFPNHIDNSNHDAKINLGSLVLQALFESLIVDNQHLENSDPGDGYEWNQDSIKNTRSRRQHQRANPYFRIPSHTPIIISEGSITLFKLTVAEVESEVEALAKHLPNWIVNVVINKNPPKFTKIPFFILPHEKSGIKTLRKERLSSTDMLQVRKIIEHICEKMMTNISEENSPGSEKNSSLGNRLGEPCQEEQTFAPENVELLCNDQVLDLDCDLRTVKHFIWKSGGELTLHYLPIKEGV